MKFLEWLIHQNTTVNKNNIFPPVLEPQMAVNFLGDYLLGEDWYTPLPITTGQVNTEVVFDILRKYSRQFRKEIREQMRMR